MKYNLTSPCANCPFRSDIEPFITPERIDEIIDSNTGFPCHKTVDYDHENEEGFSEGRETENSQHCAGLLIMLEKMEQPHQMMRIMERLHAYDRRKLNMEAPVYDDLGDALAAHEEAII